MTLKQKVVWTLTFAAYAVIIFNLLTYTAPSLAVLVTSAVFWSNLCKGVKNVTKPPLPMTLIEAINRNKELHNLCSDSNTIVAIALLANMYFIIEATPSPLGLNFIAILIITVRYCIVSNNYAKLVNNNLRVLS